MHQPFPLYWIYKIALVNGSEHKAAHLGEQLARLRVHENTSISFICLSFFTFLSFFPLKIVNIHQPIFRRPCTKSSKRVATFARSSTSMFGYTSFHSLTGNFGDASGNNLMYSVYETNDTNVRLAPSLSQPPMFPVDIAIVCVTPHRIDYT